ncbi:c-type cytochrome [Vibrio profundi]|uniref:c-type cytochrome n=1 Tax=Vibrio profundi TaxID=1774960 RepID=UPI00373594D6
MFKTFFILVLVSISSSSLASDFGDPALGKIKSPSCVFCHGATGTTSNPAYPNLSGQDALYLLNAMKAYQNGERQGAFSDMMKAQLHRLNEQDLKDIAAFYSSQTK